MDQNKKSIGIFINEKPDQTFPSRRPYGSLMAEKIEKAYEEILDGQGSRCVTPEEVVAMAKKYGLSPQTLLNIATLPPDTQYKIKFGR